MKKAFKGFTVRHAIFAFTALYVAGFGALFFFARNEEFVAYMVVVIAVMAFVIGLSEWLALPDYVLALLSVAGLLHVAGGAVHVQGDVLYGYELIRLVQGADPGFYILRYDQIAHSFGYGVVALTLWHVLKRQASGLPVAARAFFAIAGAAGLGSLNEIIEFIASVLLPHTGVGDYANNSLDLVFNMLGAVIATGAIWLTQRPRQKAQR